MTKDEKNSALGIYRNRVLSLIDFFSETKCMEFPGAEVDYQAYYQSMRTETEEIYTKGQLTRLKQYCHDLSEPLAEVPELKLLLEDRLGESIEWITTDFEKTVSNVIKRNRIKDEREFYIISENIEGLLQGPDVDLEMIEKLNALLRAFDAKMRKY